MLFKPGTQLYAYEVVREDTGQVVYVNYLGANFVPNLAENSDVMNRAVDLLIESPNISRIVFVQQRNYNHNTNQIFMLQEIANLYVFLTKQEKILSPTKLSMSNSEFLPQRHNDIAYLLMTLKRDPIGCYFELQRFLEEEKANLQNTAENMKFDQLGYTRLLERFYSLLGQTKLIQEAEKYFSDYSFGSRNIYFHLFRADIIPNFTFTRLASSLPDDAEIVEQYEIGDGEDKSVVTILKRKEDTKHFYHLMPPEYTLDEHKQGLLNLARNVLIEHQPKAEEFTDPEKTRQVFFNISRDLLTELSETRQIKINYNELNKLAKILVRHTIGFGLIEVLLQDKNLQDIVLNAPISANPIYLRHGTFDECSTNIIPSKEDGDSWAAKFRMTSGRPLDEANPILDTDLNLGKIRARISVIQRPLSPNGLAYAVRRHREDPWTLPLFVKRKMLNSFSAGLLSFLIDGSRTMLIAGTRSSGKCVDGNTLIQLSDGNLKQIKDLIGDEKKEIEDGKIYNPYSEIYCPSLDGMSINNKKVTDVWKRSSPEKVVKIKTKSGNEIITTMEHPYFSYNNGMTNIRADSLVKGDLIASPRRLFINNNEINIDLKNHLCLVKELDNCFVLKGKTNSQLINFPKKLTPELAELIGMVIGDGHLNKTKIEFHNQCKELRERYINLLKFFNVGHRIFDSHTTTVVQVTSRVLSRLFNEVFEIPFGKKSDKVIIPQLILKSGDNVLSSFLRGYFDCDGYVPKMKRDLELVTASKIMSEQLKLALLRFGITCFTKTKMINGVDYYRVLIRGSFVNNFAKHIGFFHPMKKTRLEKILNSNYIENTNVDIIPEGNLILRDLRRVLRASPKQHRFSGKDYWAYENNQYRVTRNWFKKIVGFYNQRYEKLSSIKSQIDLLRKLANFDLKRYLSKLECLRKMMGVSYGNIASQIGMSETGVRKSLQFQRIENLDGLINMSKSLDVFRKQELSEPALLLLNQLSYEKIIINSILVGVILSNMRNTLNISNEEFSLVGISKGSVSNFFNGVYNPSLRTIQLISKKVIEVFDSAISFETEKILKKATLLANSDIFWDEIISVDLIDKVDNHVYDLTVEGTHNFVANGLVAHNTSLLGSLMLEIMPKFRIICLEDTLELPVESLRKLKYDILRMKVRSSLLKTTNEIGADEGIRTSLRLGDSCLIVGEVRSLEAKALYEAMRVGALANVVAGTIHGASPYGVFDRVVNDLEVPVTSFKATDCIVVANPVKTPDGMSSMRRIIQLAEVRKHWTKDPQEEGGFVDLLKYNVEKDELEPSEELINGDSEVIKSIASGVKGWAGNWDAVYDNILLRAKIKQEMVDVAKKSKIPNLLESKFNALSNNMFHEFSQEIMSEVGLPESDRVFTKWQEWLMKQVKGKKI